MPGARALFPTGVHIAIPDGHVGYIRPRSGLALKHGIDVLGGVIDSDYRGDVGVILINHGTKPFEVVEGDRIAQLVFHPLTPVLLVEGGSLGVSARGTGGFGSTGVGVL
jgi:dUTP pyrophosphatase